MAELISQAAWGRGVATATNDDTILDVWFPGGELGLGTEVSEDGPTQGGSDSWDYHWDEILEVHTCQVSITIPDLAKPPADTVDAYLRLHLLSHRLVKPRTINLDGIFDVLATVAWTSLGPCHVDFIEEARARVRRQSSPLLVTSVDKFPRMTDYVVPSGVRIGDADRVRLGAYLAPGTTVMHEGFVNFNAGTLGSSMVEGRISAGVVVANGTDIGGGASIMGTLSGGGKEQITIGQNCLIGANAGVGISLGDGCIVEAGCYITAGAKITLPDGVITPARQLSGMSDLLFRRHSVTGALEALPRSGSWGGLNPALH